MPGFVHLFYGFAFGLFLMWVTNYRFSGQHVLVFGFNCYIGPDIGTGIWFLTRSLGPSFSKIVVLLFHHPVMFPFTLGIPLTWFWFYLVSLKGIKRGRILKIVKMEKAALSKTQIFLLITAASYTHFFFDYIFDSDGRGQIFRWVINTGEFQNPYLDIYLIIPITILVLFVTAYSLTNDQGNATPQEIKWKRSVIYLVLFTALYEIYLGIRLYFNLPAIGEEADFGLIIFSVIFIILPWILCGITMNPEIGSKNFALIPDK